MRRTNIYLEPRQCEALDRRAAEEGVSRAELVRRLLAQGLEGGRRGLEADLQAIRDSFGALLDGVAPERGPGRREQHLERVRAAGG
jgi:hypothetical protein